MLSLESVYDDNTSEIGWIIDAWRARCYGWDPEYAAPLPDYHIAIRRRSRPDPNRRSIPNSEYQQLVMFMKCIRTDKRIQEMASEIKVLVSNDCVDDIQLCWRISRSHFHRYGPTLPDNQDVQSDIDHWCNTLISNNCDQARLESVFGKSYYLPPNSSFLISDISNLSASALLPCPSLRYHLVIVDPPWDNKSVQRSRSYPTMRHSTLKTLPIDELLDEDNGIVCVWVTNDPCLRSFIIEELFPSWNIQYHTVWYWIKLPLDLAIDVPDLDSSHHKPYEQIIVGVRNNIMGQKCSLPQNNIFASFPESHSRKPVLDEIFNRYMLKDCRKLEVFARDIKPGWTAWGNEPLKYQDSRRFQSIRHKKRKVLD